MSIWNIRKMRDVAANAAYLGEMDQDQGFDLIRGAENNDLQDVSGALDEGASVNFQEPETGLTALHKAAARGHIDIVEFLFDMRRDELDLHLKDKYGRTAVDLAGRFGKDEVVEYLVQKMYPEL